MHQPGCSDHPHADRFGFCEMQGLFRDECDSQPEEWGRGVKKQQMFQFPGQQLSSPESSLPVDDVESRKRISAGRIAHSMSDPQIHKTVFLIAIAVFTAITTYTDLRWRKIFNKVTVPMWATGWIYQGIFFQTDGLLHGLYGFLVGFGIFFVLWMIGSAGGGDVKLMGALSVWLGAGLTLKVILASLIFVIMGTLAVVIGGILKNGWRKTRARYSKRETVAGKGRRAVTETLEQRSKRRVMAFAMPVALATWSILLLFPAQW